MNSLAFNLIDAGIGSLTSREAEILYWVSEGEQNKDIAARLSISLCTVQKHIKNMYRKLQVHNKIEALNKTKWLIASLYRNRN